LQEIGAAEHISGDKFATGSRRTVISAACTDITLTEVAVNGVRRQ